MMGQCEIGWPTTAEPRCRPPNPNLPLQRCAAPASARVRADRARSRIVGAKSRCHHQTPAKRLYTGQSFNEVLRWTKRSVFGGSASFLLFVRVVLPESAPEAPSGWSAGHW